jgi:hypothetical protein
MPSCRRFDRRALGHESTRPGAGRISSTPAFGPFARTYHYVLYNNPTRSPLLEGPRRLGTSVRWTST